MNLEKQISAVSSFKENESIYVLKESSGRRNKQTFRYEGAVIRLLERYLLVRFYDHNGLCYIQRVRPSQVEKR